jgi:hypothetical protein
VPSVVGVQITEFDRLDELGGDGVLPVLPSAASQLSDDGTALAAELLTLDPGPIQLTGVSA